MTREEEIRQEMSKIAGTHPDWSKNDCMRMGFLEGVKWADENPTHCSVRMVGSQSYSKQQLRDMGFAFDLNGNIVDPKELSDMTTDYVLKKAREWVKNAFAGVFGEGLANSIADEFVKAIKGE